MCIPYQLTIMFLSLGLNLHRAATFMARRKLKVLVAPPYQTRCTRLVYNQTHELPLSLSLHMHTLLETRYSHNKHNHNIQSIWRPSYHQFNMNNTPMRYLAVRKPMAWEFQMHTAWSDMDTIVNMIDSIKFFKHTPLFWVHVQIEIERVCSISVHLATSRLTSTNKDTSVNAFCCCRRSSE